MKYSWMRIFVALVAVLVLADIYMVFFYAPTEKFMGDIQRLMYFHVSSAWVAFISFFVVFICGILYLWKRSDRFDRLALASAEIGVFFTTLVLITGPIWARPVWNTWWTWDPRLTTTLILWFIYVGYLVLRKTSLQDERGKRMAALFGIIGFIDVPIVHLSVTWWRSIHPQVITDRGINMTLEMAITLFFSAFTFLTIYLLLLFFRYRIETARGIIDEGKRKLSLTDG
ncbi:cytochrome c biogenesis protein CcsA [Microaerobacter geothermalis]|uniref:cytochrome c biogenesis protein n=1 Tax=Microaerobacter geothermalis TaxID=674972 RepID=UPI001F1E5A40|nr:cytochrome c biogenesis protein CcsA [Microaerobacter geothermalis]MCF6092548.1 cytochrome c biogenesis protein CcsA [Microaerobacter geothermalis]